MKETNKTLEQVIAELEELRDKLFVATNVWNDYEESLNLGIEILKTIA